MNAYFIGKPYSITIAIYLADWLVLLWYRKIFPLSFFILSILSIFWTILNFVELEAVLPLTK